MPHPALHQILRHIKSEPSRTWSIIITLYGDAIVPRGGGVWLATLLDFFRALDIGDGVVRTAMSRLAADGWLERQRVGRNSFYRLADIGRNTFSQATEHIYNATAPDWDGAFDLILLAAGGDREATRSVLQAQGYGLAAPGLWLLPAGKAVPPSPEVIRLTARTDIESSRRLAAQAWPLEAIAAAYTRFIEAFSPLRQELQADAEITDLEALAARVLLIHEYRRIILRDPILPAELLPVDWPGTVARSLCATLYRRLLPESERWLDAHALDEAGVRSKSIAEVYRRFGT